ncbi:MAG: aldehyde dehydrogenase [Akkermansiaceae bacterium]|nr:aldehyde dehydrogenase [Akkermansiaceae bacterium]
MKKIPAALIDGVWTPSRTDDPWAHRNPADAEEVLSQVPAADRQTALAAAAAAGARQRTWGERPVEARLEVVRRWQAGLDARQEDLVALMTREIGKPLRDAQEECSRGLRHLESVVRISARQLVEAPASGSFRTRLRPVGTILAITPWNNPLAIPVGKIAPALAFGNGVVWKPAMQAAGLATMVADCLLEAADDPPPLAVVFGGEQVAKMLLEDAPLDAVTFTGSCAAGREVIRHCGSRARPVQAEMGGNNAVIVMPGVTLDEVVETLLPACFSFSGQRCTAVRRVIVHEALREEFARKFTAAASALAIGRPDDPATVVGPLISTAHRDRVLGLVRQEARRGSCQVLSGGAIPAGLEAGAWMEPTVVAATVADSPLVREESFAPVVVLQSCRGIEEAVALANATDYGLVAGLFTRDPADEEIFLRTIEAGMVRVNPADFAIAPEAPFTGWKRSGLGPPEHGPCDRDFHAKIQVVYP